MKSITLTQIAKWMRENLGDSKSTLELFDDGSGSIKGEDRRPLLDFDSIGELPKALKEFEEAKPCQYCGRRGCNQ